MKMTALIPLTAVALVAAPAVGATVERSSGLAAPQTLTAWHGCWQLVDPGTPAGTLVCVLPGADAASARIASVEDGEIVSETVLSVDGVARQVEEGGCTGTETASWSQDGRRVFLRTELDCSGVRRLSTGVIALVAENEWVDIQTVSIGEQHASRTLRYRAVRPENTPAAAAALLPRDRQLVLEAARLQTSAPLDVEAVVEASRTVAAPVVEALLAARRQGFALNAQRLVQLERAGVPTPVIDMMIALSYPSTFAVQERRPAAQASYTDPWRSRSAMAADCYDPFMPRLSRAECDILLMSSYGRYNRLGFGMYGSSRYGYSPWGYDPYGWNYGREPIVVIVRPRDEERTRGEVVKGVGYTSGGATGTGRTARSRDDTSRGSGGASSQPAATSGSGNSSGTSTTSSDTSTGRRAVPRGGGGGGEQQEP